MDEVAKVAPLAGARIEIVLNGFLDVLGFVAPLAGARIEIMDELPLDLSPKVSLPSRERGLKYRQARQRYLPVRRSPRGSVD